MRFVLVAISAVLALTAVVLSNRPEGEPGSASSKTRVSWRLGGICKETVRLAYTAGRGHPLVDERQ